MHRLVGIASAVRISSELVSYFSTFSEIIIRYNFLDRQDQGQPPQTISHCREIPSVSTIAILIGHC